MLLLLLPPPPRNAGRGGRGGAWARGAVRDLAGRAEIYTAKRRRPPSPGPLTRPGGGDERGWLPLPDPGPDRSWGYAEHREPRGRRGPPVPGVCASPSSVRAVPAALGAARPAWRAPRVCAAPGPGVPRPSPSSSRVMRRQLVRIRESALSRPGVPAPPFLPRAALSFWIVASYARGAAAGWLRPVALPPLSPSRCSAGPLESGLHDPEPPRTPLTSSSSPPLAPPRPYPRSRSLGARPALPAAASSGSCSNWSGRGLKPPEAGGEEAYRADSPRLGAE